MQDTVLWAAWYVLLLAVPFAIIASLVRESLAHRRATRRAGLLH